MHIDKVANGPSVHVLVEKEKHVCSGETLGSSDRKGEGPGSYK